ncbi:MAG: hypothetical protein ACTHMC_07680 [Pseudobacter sp.]|uniref:hypothetical protein n=1 Tax=Pseudobacter sp. TaxID=2045420 RepID=UPI003F7E4E7F
MKRKLTASQQAKVNAAKAFLKITTDPDRLYTIVVIIGPALFGSFFQSNSDTVWSRIENPGFFRYDEMIIIAEVLEITLQELLALVSMQIEHNVQQRKKGLPVGRKKYQGRVDDQD